MILGNINLSLKVSPVTEEDKPAKVHLFKTLDPSKERGSYSFNGDPTPSRTSGMAHLAMTQTSLWVISDTPFLSSNRHHGGCTIHLVRPTSHAGQPYKTLHNFKASGATERSLPNLYNVVMIAHSPKGSAGFIFKTSFNRSKRPNLTRSLMTTTNTTETYGSKRMG